MDKKQNYYSRQGSNKALGCESRKSDVFTSKPLPRNGGKRRENPNSTNFKNDNSSQRNFNNAGPKIRSNVDKRPKPRSYGASATATILSNDASSITSTGLTDDDTIISTKNGRNDFDVEFNSVYTPGSKKQNLNHLLNFHYDTREHHNNGINVFGRNNGNRGYIKKHKYNKEQFLQANFQFVIKSISEPFIDASSPDTLVEWSLIEQINIQTTEEPQCPICLYPPISAKLTRCGHVYCWPCILHYLALSDKTWRKCPICYEAIHVGDLKSTSIVQQKNFKVGDFLTLQLMRRAKGSIFVEKMTNEKSSIKGVPHLSESVDIKLFSKFLLANSRDILIMLEKERNELICGEDLDCPESVFIQQALDLLKERKMLIAKELNIEYDDLDDYIKIEKLEELPKSEDTIEPELENDDGSCSENDVISLNSGGAVQKDKFYYFYQSVDGQNIFLHPLNVKMLQAMYGSLDKSPSIISSKIIQKENQSMDEEHRKKFTCLGHLPLTCQFEIVEVQLEPPILSNQVIQMFKDDIILRQKTRQRRAREEKKREKEINEINERQMGKLISRSASIDIQSSQQFPTCGMEDPVCGSSYANSINSTYASELADSPPIQLSYRNSFASFANILSSPKKELWPSLENKHDIVSGFGWPKDNTKTLTSIGKSEKHTNKLTDIHDDDDNNDEEVGPVLQTRNTLSDVLAKAFEKKKKTSADRNENCNGGGGSGVDTKKNKNKNKKTLLFSSGMNLGRN